MKPFMKLFQRCEDESEEDSDERREGGLNVMGLSMKKFDFPSVGIKYTLYETHINKSPADFVSLFIDDALLQHISLGKKEICFTKKHLLSLARVRG